MDSSPFLSVAYIKITLKYVKKCVRVPTLPPRFPEKESQKNFFGEKMRGEFFRKKDPRRKSIEGPENFERGKARNAAEERLSLTNFEEGVMIEARKGAAGKRPAP